MPDLIIVDDHPVTRETVKMHVLYHEGLEYVRPVAFEKPSLAKNYILRAGVKLAGVLCDMRIPEELEGPRQLYDELRKRGLNQNFWFMTGNFSDHDATVVRETGAQYTLKEDVPKVLEQIAAQYAPKMPPAPEHPPAFAAAAR